MKQIIIALIALLVFPSSAYSQSMSKKDREKLLDKAMKYEEKERYDKAYKCWIQLIDEEPFFAGYFLGSYFENGLGVPRDINKAIYYYTISANTGDFYSQNRLGRILSNLDNIEEYGALTYYWNKIAATNPVGANFENEVRSNIYNLAECYELGIGVEKNETLSDIWTALAAYLDMGGAQDKVSEKYSINTHWDTFEQEDSVSYVLANHFCKLILKHPVDESKIDIVTVKMFAEDSNYALKYNYIEKLFYCEDVPISVKIELGDILLFYYKSFKYDLFKAEKIEALIKEFKSTNKNEDKDKWYLKQFINAAIDVTEIIEKN